MSAEEEGPWQPGGEGDVDDEWGLQTDAERPGQDEPEARKWGPRTDAEGPDQDDPEEREWQRRAASAEEAARRRAREDAVDHLAFTLREAAGSVDAALRLALAQGGFGDLPLSALHVMVLARRSRPISAIAERMRCSGQRVSQHVAALERLGLVDKVASPLDRRVRLVEVSETGSALLERLRDRLLLVLGFVADEVGEQRLAGLQEELARIAVLDPHPDPWGRW